MRVEAIRPTRVPASVRVALALGCLALAIRPLLVALTSSPTVLLVTLFAALLAAGLLARVDASRNASPGRLLAVVALGVSAFAAGRALGGGLAPHPATARFLALNLFAAVAEEAFFRRAVFGALLRSSGAGAAIGGSAVLFAVVHVSVYGFWALPIDLAAGLLLSWQRHVAGTWTAPALTHAIANVLVLL